MPRPSTISKNWKSVETLGNARSALELASGLAPLIPVPLLSSLFTTANYIVDASLKIKQDRRAAGELSEYVANITCQIHKTLRGREDMIDKDLNLALTELNDIFDEIRRHLEYHLSMGLWHRVCYRSNISEKIIEYRSRLSYSMSTFTTTSNIRQELALKSLKNGMNDLSCVARNNQMFNGQYRLYRWGEVEILSRHHLPASTWYKSDTELYDSKIDGKVKFLKVYRRQHSYERALSILRLVREMPSIPFAQLDGYGEDSSSPFLVLKGCHKNMFDYLCDLELLDYFQKRLGFMIDMKSAMLFLASHNLRWKGWVEGLMISENGRLCLGCNDDIIELVVGYENENKILISWPKPDIAEGLHALIEREDNALAPLHTVLRSSKNSLDIITTASLWGAYIAELNCGIASFVTVGNIAPPLLGSIGYTVPDGHGISLVVLDDGRFKGSVNVRTTRSCDDGVLGEVFHRYKNEADINQRVALPFEVTDHKGTLYMDRTSYVQLSTHGWAAEHLIRSWKDLRRSGWELDKLIVVTGVIERAAAKFPSAEPKDSTSDGSYKPTQFNAYAADDRGFLRRPWGYITEDGDTNGTQRDALEPKSIMPGKWECSTMDGNITAEIEQSYKLSCFQFSLTEVKAIERMYNSIVVD